MPHRRWAALALRIVSTILAAAASVSVSRAAGAVEPPALALRLAASTRYTGDVRMTHVITNDLPGMYKALVGSKADPVTILEDRTIAIAAGHAGAIDESFSDSRRYGGDQAKNTTVVTRASKYVGTIAADGTRTPTDQPLPDPGDGALAQLPAGPIATGGSWTFSRSILVDRDLGSGSMTYTDTLERIDVRAGHTIAVIDVKGSGRVDVAADLKAKGFQTTDMTLAGSAEFDETAGLPGVQHYTAHAVWNTHVLWVHLGLIFDDTYDAVPWSVDAR
jgi:hypothetical protein